MSKYKKGDAFVIEINDVLSTVGSEYGIYPQMYTMWGLNDLYFEEDDLDHLSPLGAQIEQAYKDGAQNPSSVGYDHGYEAGLNDAWECMKKIHTNTAMRKKLYGEMTMTEIYEESNIGEVMSLVKEYEDEIRVGDILRHDTTETEEMVVTHVHDEYVSGVCIKGKLNDVGATFFDKPKGRWVKTGRHVENVLEILSK